MHKYLRPKTDEEIKEAFGSMSYTKLVMLMWTTVPSVNPTFKLKLLAEIYSRKSAMTKADSTLAVYEAHSFKFPF